MALGDRAVERHVVPIKAWGAGRGMGETWGLVGGERRHASSALTDFMALSRASGVTLTETLVAILIMSTAALGLAGLQAENLRASREGYVRTVAVQRAADLLDRIRANGEVGADEFEVNAGPPGPEDCLHAACDPATMARFDVAVWKCALGAWREAVACRRIREAGALADADAMPGLPEGDGTVAVDPALGLVTVTVSWQQAGSVSRSHISIASRI